MKDDDPFWYKDAIIYELHVKAFRDSNGNGIGDFRGLAEKLDYLQDLGVTALWLLPFYPSPLKDDGYDISDYRSVHQDYGTLQDFKYFIREAHRRKLKVITELVINHTSDQHPWFQAARRAKPGSARHRFYVWSDTDKKFPETRIIFCDVEKSNWAWDSTANAYYWHRFFSHQPDLNLNNPQVVKAVIKVMEFWFDLGVDGLRLDAVPYLCVREGTNNENLPETHEVIRQMRAQLDRKYQHRIFLAEANMWPEEVRPYFGDGDECHMAFHFPVMPRIFMAVRMEDRQPIVDIMSRTLPIPDNCQWALFLRNHDELTLEMVSNEERDYMWREYARDPRMRINLGIRRRLAPLVNNSVPRLMMLNSLLMSFPGSPVIYYGDEIGMGDNIYVGDRNGVRTPMQWSSERNAGFSDADPAQLYLPVIMDSVYGYQAVSVEAQERDPSSFLYFMKRIIALRRQYKAFGRGTLDFVFPKNRRVLSYLRRYKDEVILCVVNLSRFVQPAEMNLSEFKGWTPVEMFGRTEFPPIGDLPYFFTLGPHSFYWFKLEPEPHPIKIASTGQITDENVATVSVSDTGDSLFDKSHIRALEDALEEYIVKQRWYQGKAKTIAVLSIKDHAKLGAGIYFVVSDVAYGEGGSEQYALPIRVIVGEKAERLARDVPGGVIAYIKAPQASGILFDALSDQATCRNLLAIIADGRRFITTSGGELRASPTSAFPELPGNGASPLEVSHIGKEQSNTSVVYGDKLILKLFRRIEWGANPDLEVCRYLTSRKFPAIPHVSGSLEYVNSDRSVASVAMLQLFVKHDVDGWTAAQDALRHYFSGIDRDGEIRIEAMLETMPSALDLSRSVELEQYIRMVGAFAEDALRLGNLTAELHLALAQPTKEKAFSPCPLPIGYLETLAEEFSNKVRRVLEQLNIRMNELEPEHREAANRVIASSWSLIDRFRSLKDLLTRSGSLTRLTLTRFHGDYHLGQVLKQGDNFVIFDFEGEPLKSLAERRLKGCPLRDVAGMLRSFSYASSTALIEYKRVKGVESKGLNAASFLWERTVSAAFIRGYYEKCGESSFTPTRQEEFGALLTAFILDKAYYELQYELSYRPNWVHIPLCSIDRYLTKGLIKDE